MFILIIFEDVYAYTLNRIILYLLKLLKSGLKLKTTFVNYYILFRLYRIVSSNFYYKRAEFAGVLKCLITIRDTNDGYPINLIKDFQILI